MMDQSHMMQVILSVHRVPIMNGILENYTEKDEVNKYNYARKTIKTI